MDESGQIVPFKLNWAQVALYDGMWYLNVILKARQLGFSTFVMVYMLDSALFNSNLRCGVIAHNKEDAEYLFRDKVKFAYDHLPEWVKQMRPATTGSKQEIVFNNNSSIRVSTSFRGGTVQILHVSEFGKICRKYPDKAQEIVSGAFNAVHAGQQIFVESTAEGRDGEFYRMVKKAQDKVYQGQILTELDFKYWFFPWWRDPRYRLDPTNVVIHPRMNEYFARLESKHNIRLLLSQKAWYAKKSETMGELMWREYPSTAEEAFDAQIKGAYFALQLARSRKEGRITKVPHTSGALVDTWWDLGVGDETSIWFTQDHGSQIKVIDYYENSGEGLPHYVKILHEKALERSFQYGRHVAPHDIEVTEFGTSVTRRETARSLGINFDVCQKLPKEDQIEAARNLFSVCTFDEECCGEGIGHLDAYRKEWDDKRGIWKDKPYHGPESNAADAFEVMAVAHGYNPRVRNVAKQKVIKSSAGWT